MTAPEPKRSASLSNPELRDRALRAATRLRALDDAPIDHGAVMFLAELLQTLAQRLPMPKTTTRAKKGPAKKAPAKGGRS